MEIGVKGFRQAATFGRPLGSYIEEPQAYLKAHAKEPNLPYRTTLLFPDTSERQNMGTWDILHVSGRCTSVFKLG
jgi:hypothetical protein